jgi:hypothetical protein
LCCHDMHTTENNNKRDERDQDLQTFFHSEPHITTESRKTTDTIT